MNERLLQFIWQHQYFNRDSLKTCSGQAVQIIFQGTANTNQGPDFLEARIVIDHVQLAGSVELHLQTSDWHSHGHTGDKHYSNVILHVVWQHNATDGDGVLELKGRVAHSLLNRYEELMQQENQIPCNHFIHSVPELVWSSWKERMMSERLFQKAERARLLLQNTNRHWEEMFWQLIVRNFGTPLNSEAFEAIAKSLPVSVLAKHKNQIHQLEALLLGQAGLLETDFTDSYAVMLQKEYRYLKKKLGLKAIYQPLNFLRMRPSGFPTVRLAQMAMLVHQSNHLFSKMIEAKSLDIIRQMLNVTANDFWNTHYTLQEASGYKKKTTGKIFINNLLINTILPVLFLYADEHNNYQIKQQVLEWLQLLPKEDNQITRMWENANAPHKNAFDSQALLFLKANYCDTRKCLSCAIGNAVLKR